MNIESRSNYERDDRSDSFRMVGEVIAAVAEKHGLDIDDTTRQRWSDLMGLLREFDTLIDDHQMPACQALQELADFERFKVNYPSLGPPDIDIDTHVKMVRRVAVIIEHGRYISETKDINEFIYHRREEVDHTAELLADCATGDVTTQPGFYTNFMSTMRSMGEAANFIDTMTDHRQDILEGKSKIPSTQGFYRAVGGCAISEFTRASHVLSDAKVWRLFYDMSVMRLKNRLSQGKKAYSSLKNL